jgi:predicted DNA-binding transcriptional regulator AlpA
MSPEQSHDETLHEILTVSEVAEILRCKPSSVYNLTRSRGIARYDNPIPVLRLPMGLRFRRSSVLAWLAAQEQGGVQ